jgi:hypothetical protein
MGGVVGRTGLQIITARDGVLASSSSGRCASVWRA